MKRQQLKKFFMQSDKVLVIMLLAVVFIWGSAGVIYPAGNISLVIVKSRAISPYTDVAASVKKTLLGCQNNIDISELNFEDDKTTQDLKNNIERIKPTLILALGTSATKIVRQSVPLNLVVVYTMILDPWRSNIEPPGVAMDIPPEAKLREVKRILPGVKKLGVIYSPQYHQSYEAMLQACQKLGLYLIGKQIDSQKEFPVALDEVFKEIDCFIMIADPNIYLPKTTEYLLLYGLKQKVAVVGLSSAYTKAGALVAFDCDYEDLGKQAAEIVLRILNNDILALKETALPRKIKFSLNLSAANRLGVTIPEKIIKEANEVFGK